MYGDDEGYVMYHATAETAGERVKALALGAVPGYSLLKMLYDSVVGEYYSNHEVYVDVKSYKSAKSVLDNASAITEALEPMIEIINSGLKTANGVLKGVGKAFGVFGGISTSVDIIDAIYEIGTNRYNVERAVEYSMAVKGSLEDSLFVAKFAEIYMDIMLKDGLVEFQKVTFSHKEDPWIIKWNDDHAKKFIMS